MCSCCGSSPCGVRQYTPETEPIAQHPFDQSWESEVRCFLFLPSNIISLIHHKVLKLLLEISHIMNKSFLSQLLLNERVFFEFLAA